MVDFHMLDKICVTHVFKKLKFKQQLCSDYYVKVNFSQRMSVLAIYSLNFSHKKICFLAIVCL